MLREAAAEDPQTAGLRLRRVEERRRATVTDGLTLMPCPGFSDQVRDGIWAVTAVEVYQLLTDLSGWTVEQYEHWLGDATEIIDHGAVRSTYFTDPDGIALEASWWVHDPTTVPVDRDGPLFADPNPVPAVHDCLGRTA